MYEYQVLTEIQGNGYVPKLQMGIATLVIIWNYLENLKMCKFYNFNFTLKCLFSHNVQVDECNG